MHAFEVEPRYSARVIGKSNNCTRGGWTMMDDDLLRIARRIFETVQERRLDYLSTTQTAVRDILTVRPDISASDAMAALTIVQRSPIEDKGEDLIR